MQAYLQRMLDYTAWANLGLLEFLRSQPPEVLGATAAGVYGSIRETFAHLLTSERRYMQYLSGEPQPAREADERVSDFDSLQQLASANAATLAQLLEVAAAPETFLPLSDGNRSAATVLTQLFMHGCEHRAHIGTILGANGMEPPDLDSWAYGIFKGGDDWPEDWGPEPPGR